MKKFIITAIITVVLIIPVFADSALSGHVQSQVVYDFSEPENQTLKYNIKGSLASFTVDFTNLSFNKKGEKKPYVDISASAADFLEEPIVVCRASGTCVTPKECKRK